MENVLLFGNKFVHTYSRICFRPSFLTNLLSLENLIYVHHQI